MRILVITSCTGEKSVEDDLQLTLNDFAQGAAHVTAREKKLKHKLVPAEDLYTGMQHQRLMRGVKVARQSGVVQCDLRILSAGYGLVPHDRKVAPYEVTFATMKSVELKKWARQLGVPEAIRRTLAEPYDLGLILLGEDYLAACELDESVKLGGPTLLFGGKATAKKLPKLEGMHMTVLANSDATRFSCGMVGIKGELAARLLEQLSAAPSRLNEFLHSGEELLSLLVGGAASSKTTRSAGHAKPEVDRVIDLPNSWRNKVHRSKLAYFIPDWDDQVDPDFDFETDTHSGGTGDWSNQVYAHQMFKEPNYDGILISKIVAEQSKKKAERINQLGVHRHLRVPRDFPIMGDCGAFGYINDYEPPFTTNEILEYYTRLDFDYGVSIDHFAIGEDADRKRRYELTIENARDFIAEHNKLGLNWTPIGALQGWDEASFAKAAKQYAAMGYRYIAVGAMVRRRTPEILSIVKAVRNVIPAETKLHLFGVARLNAINDLARAGVNSADSASCLRKAWLGGSGNNYLTVDGVEYGAIRIPEAEKSFRAKRMVSDGRATLDQVRKLERACIDILHAFDRGEHSVDHVLEVLYEYDQLITPERQDNRKYLRKTLEAKPWKSCPCDICRKHGIDVVIFRGNNRNRRRGFHNTYAFYRLMQRALAGEVIASSLRSDDPDSQMNLDLTAEEVG
ncbi:tRNA-guanine transglycosylase DpdA [Noviherbaspirillum massiliense]|uniref:tRNA-guanine transglycosylase DpdA n=1 Tax=Noviherbaspirillum massiliense TaxID=1465823 RepID=UPI000315EA36|nr:tRNA-guanine transglycosylase DpdA [Noviherbaspirillum massiliense]